MAKWAEIKCTNCTALEERLEAAQRDAQEAEEALAQQDDLVQVAVAAALREAADAVEDYCSDAPDLAGHGHSEAIRDIITAIHKGG